MELLGRSSLAVWKFFGDNYSDNAERVAKQRWNEFMKKNLKKAIVLSVLTMSALGITSSASAADPITFTEFVNGSAFGGGHQRNPGHYC